MRVRAEVGEGRCRAPARWILVALTALVVAAPARTRAQDGDPIPSRRAAAEAYDRGSAFYLNGEYGRAARWFETAYRLAPSAPALIQAIRAQLRAGHRIHATNLALRLLGRHGDEPEARQLAEDVLREHGGDFFRLDVDCDDCTLEVDGRVWSHTAAMLSPATEHQVVVTRGDARREVRVRGERGERRVIPAPGALDDPASRASAASEDGAEVPREAPPSDTGMPLEPWLFGVGVGLTVASAGVLIWSGLDTLDGVEAFEESPTLDEFEAGETKERRTNWLIGVTAGLGAVTVLLAVLTDWDGDPGAPADAARVAPVLAPSQLGLAVSGSF